MILRKQQKKLFSKRDISTALVCLFISPFCHTNNSATAQQQNSGCSVCGDGKEVGNFDAIIQFDGREDLSCENLQLAGEEGQIEVFQCGFLKTYIAETCECRDIPSSTESPTISLTKSPVNPSESPTKSPEGCSVCGDGKIVGNKDAIFEFEGQPSIQCKSLEAAGEQGAIPLEQCAFLPSVIAVCRCQEKELPSTKPPVDVSTKSPIDDTKSPVDTPTKSPINAPTKSPLEQKDTESPKPSPSPTDLNLTTFPTSSPAPSPAPTGPTEPTTEPLTEAPVTAAPVAPTVPLPLTKRPRCGFNWGDANRNCYDFCTSGDDCTGGRNCFQDLSFACPVKTLKRCGNTFGDANTNCRGYCDTDIDCYPMKCYSEVEDICNARCGTTWDKANSQCEFQCRTLENVDCPEGQRCYRDMVRVCANSGGMSCKGSVVLILMMVGSILLLSW